MRKMRILRLGGTIALVVAVGAIGSLAPGPATPKRAYAQAAPTLVWSDEFNGPSIDTSNWGFEQGYVRNHEAQYYTSRPENARIENGNLVIEARRENYNGFAYTSASLITQGKREFQYGRFEMRAKIPTAWGAWPAWWGLGANVGSVGWPRSGEIDMMEYYRNTLLFNVMDSNQHWSGTTEPVPAGFGNDYHTWTMDWSSSQINLYLDGALKRSYNVEDATVNGYNPFRQPWYLLANLAIGGDQGGDPSGTAFPLRYYIDYIRVYQDSGGPTPPPPPPPSGGSTSLGAHVWLIGAQSSKCLDVPGGDGVQLILYTCHSGANQAYLLHADGSIRVQDKCLDAPTGATSGSKLQVWGCNTNSATNQNQKWTLNTDGTLRSNSTGLCVDAWGQGTTDWTPVRLYTCNNGANQKWGFSQRPIIGNPSGRCLDVPLGGGNGTQLQLYTCHTGPNQALTLGPDGTLRVQNKCLDVPLGGTAGVKLQIYDCHSGPNQKWVLSGSGKIINPASGMCVDASDERTDNTTPIILYTCTGKPNQLWHM